MMHLNKLQRGLGAGYVLIGLNNVLMKSMAVVLRVGQPSVIWRGRRSAADVSNTNRVTWACHFFIVGGANAAGQKRKQTIEIATNERDSNHDPIVGLGRGLSKRP